MDEQIKRGHTRARGCSLAVCQRNLHASSFCCQKSNTMSAPRCDNTTTAVNHNDDDDDATTEALIRQLERPTFSAEYYNFESHLKELLFIAMNVLPRIRKAATSLSLATTSTGHEEDISEGDDDDTETGTAEKKKKKGNKSSGAAAGLIDLILGNDDGCDVDDGLPIPFVDEHWMQCVKKAELLYRKQNFSEKSFSQAIRKMFTGILFGKIFLDGADNSDDAIRPKAFGTISADGTCIQTHDGAAAAAPGSDETLETLLLSVGSTDLLSRLPAANRGVCVSLSKDDPKSMVAIPFSEIFVTALDIHLRGGEASSSCPETRILPHIVLFHISGLLKHSIPRAAEYDDFRKGCEALMDLLSRTCEKLVPEGGRGVLIMNADEDDDVAGVFDFGDFFDAANTVGSASSSSALRKFSRVSRGGSSASVRNGLETLMTKFQETVSNNSTEEILDMGLREALNFVPKKQRKRIPKSSRNLLNVLKKTSPQIGNVLEKIDITQNPAELMGSMVGNIAEKFASSAAAAAAAKN